MVYVLFVLLADVVQPVQVIPEYDRTLEQVLISVPIAASSGLAPGASDVSSSYLDHLFKELIEAMPSYAHLRVAVSPDDLPRISTILQEATRKRRITLDVVNQAKGKIEIDQWSQDLVEPILVGGSRRLLASMRIHRSFSENSKLSEYRFEQANQLFGSMVHEAEFVFEGGNLAFDATEDGLRVFIGFNDIELTLKNYEALGKPISRDEVLRRISAQFGGAHVVEMGNETQSDFLRHLDQAFVLLADGNVIVNTTEDDGVPDERRQLERYEAQLRELGYRVHELSNSADEIRGYRNSLNAVPFVDAETDKRKIIFPVFPGEVASGYDGPLRKRDLQGKALRAYELFENADYEPIPIRDFAFIVGGNTHCITNVLQ